MRWYPEYSTGWIWAYILCVVISGAVVGVLMWFVTRGLAATGALSALRSRGANRESFLG
jgi:energy-coupling factor transport system substrate-specific component